MKHHKVSFSIFIISFVLIILSYTGSYLYCENQNNKKHIYTSEKDFNILSITVSPSKSWTDDTLHPDTPYGAQYDGIITNSHSKTFKNWEADLYFTDNLLLDSSWNGEYTMDGTHIHFTASLDTKVVSSDNTRTFGAVLYSASPEVKLESYTISGYWVIHITELIFFRILILLSILWVMLFISFIIIQYRLRTYKKREHEFMEIVEQSVNTFTEFIDAKDTYTNGHSKRVALYTEEIAKRMGINKDERRRLFLIAMMHDCGKIGIPDSVLNKNGKLTDEEYKIIQSHTTVGDSILEHFTALPGIREGARSHHERYDGKGYPDGLKGKDIPFYARIICVADSYDAMSSDRCYRKKLDSEIILKELENNSGKQFDPEIVPYMIDMIKDGFTEKIQN